MLELFVTNAGPSSHLKPEYRSRISGESVADYSPDDGETFLHLRHGCKRSVGRTIYRHTKQDIVRVVFAIFHGSRFPVIAAKGRFQKKGVSTTALGGLSVVVPWAPGRCRNVAASSITLGIRHVTSRTRWCRQKVLLAEPLWGSLGEKKDLIRRPCDPQDAGVCRDLPGLSPLRPSQGLFR